MRKRFLSVFLFGALLTASTGSFMSCKDYDDDIDGLSERIDANQKTLDDKAAALQAALDAGKKSLRLRLQLLKRRKVQTKPQKLLPLLKKQSLRLKQTLLQRHKDWLMN